MKGYWKIILFLVVCAAAGLGIGLAAQPMDVEVAQVWPEPVDAPKPPATVQIMLVGDIMMDRGVRSSVTRNFGGDYNKLFDNLGMLHDADIVFGNLEGQVSDVGNNVGSKYSFRMDPAVIPALKTAGFSIVSFANNHIGDWNVAGFNDTRARLTAGDIAYVGAGENTLDAAAVRIIEKNGIKIGFIACSDVGPDWMRATETRSGIIICKDPELSNYIAAADAQVDFLIFTAHWGDEYVPVNSRQKTIAHAAIDAGADMVAGHHPHVIQATEYYKEKLIAYSLGNFIFDQKFSKYVDRGMLLDVTVSKDGLQNVQQHTILRDNATNQPIIIRELEPTDVVTAGGNTFACAKPTDLNQSNLWLEPVSPDHGIDDYIPQTLVKASAYATTSSETICLTSQTATALHKMVTAMQAEKLRPIVSSGYRDPEHQGNLREASDATRDPNTYPWVALAGHSEHQLGTTIDMISPKKYTIRDFENTTEYTWMQTHARAYGFVQSYTAGKEPITGYRAEAWHWRYVGADIAAKLEPQITLYEHLKFAKENSSLAVAPRKLRFSLFSTFN